MGDLMPFTLADMISYFQIYKIDSVESRDTFLRHMKTLDRVYMERKSKESKRTDTQPKPKAADSEYLVP
jgi:hypothetical protein